MTNAPTANGRGPVDTRAWLRAAGEGDAALVASLLAAGADVNAALESGETALLRATSKGRLRVVRMLLEAGADPNAEREDGFTALGVAVFLGYADIVRALLAGGADPTARGRLGTTAEKWARFSGFDEIVELLRQPDSAGAQGSAEGTAKTGTPPVLFPAEGAFSPVVPLSKLEESEASSVSDPTAGELLEDGGGEITRGDGRGQETNEREVLTLVRPRVSPSTPPSPARVVRPKVPRQPWPATLIVLGLSLVAGLIAGTYLIGARQSAEKQRPAPPAEPAAPPAAAEVQAPEPRPATTAPELQPSPPAARISETGLPAEEARAGRTDSLAVGEKTAGARRDAGAARRARRTEGRVSTPSPPVSTPTPPAKLQKGTVIQWP